MISNEVHGFEFVPPLVTPEPTVGLLPQATVLLASPFGPHTHLYSKDNFRHQHRYIKSLGYSGNVASLAINTLHDLQREPSDLYAKDFIHGYEAMRVDAPESLLPRVIAVTIHDFDLLREHVTQRVKPFGLESRQAAVELMLRLAEQPPLGTS